MKSFGDHMAENEHKLKTTDSQVILLEDRLDSAKAKICRMARDSQTNKPIREEWIQKIRFHNAERDKERK